MSHRTSSRTRFNDPDRRAERRHDAQLRQERFDRLPLAERLARKGKPWNDGRTDAA